MVLNRSHLPWAFFVLLATGAAVLLFLRNYYPAVLPFPVPWPPALGPTPPVRSTYGGTPLGLLFGTFSLLVFLFASALGVRKKRRLWRIGHVQAWLRAHIWLTILTIPLILLHCGFRFGGLMPSTLMVLYAVVMGSGFFGLAMQQFIPRLMTRTLPQEVVYEQIPHVRMLLVEAANKLWKEFAPAPPAAAAAPAEAAEPKEAALVAAKPAAASKAPPAPVLTPQEQAEDEESRQHLSAFLQEEVFPYLRLPRGEGHHLASAKQADEAFRLLKLNVTPKWQERVGQMENWCFDRRLLDQQARLHHWLHWWLLVHVPLSFALLVGTLWHAYVALAYL